MKKIFAAITLLLAVAFTAAAALPQEIRWGNEERDIAKLDSVVASLRSSADADPNILTEKAARAFIATPYVAGTLEGASEALTINTGALDCTTFVELTAALAQTVREGGTSWHDVAAKLRDMRYRNGRIDGYASRLHYVSEWISDNVYRNQIREVTEEIPGSRRQAQSLNFMTRHRDKYPALADSATYARMRAVESGLRGVNTWILPKEALNRKVSAGALRSGDIAFITTSIAGLDAIHAGIIIMDSKGVPHLLHASSKAGKVIVDPIPLPTYLSRNKSATGLRVLRLPR